MPSEEEPQLTPDEPSLLRDFILRGSAAPSAVAAADLPAGAARALVARAPASSPHPRRATPTRRLRRVHRE